MVKRRNVDGIGGNAHQRAMARASADAVGIVPVPKQDSSPKETEESGSRAIGIDTEKKPVAELRIEFLLEVLLVLYPYGAEQMNLPHNFWVGLGCWVIGAAIAVRMIWIFAGWKTRASQFWKSLVAFIVVVLFAAVMYRPIIRSYRSGQDKGGSDDRVAQTQIAPGTTQKNQTPAPHTEGQKQMKPVLKPMVPAMSLQSAKGEVLRLRKLYYSEHLGGPSGEIPWENQQLKKEGAAFRLSKHDPNTPATPATVPSDPCSQGRARIVGSVAVGDEVGIELNNDNCVDVENPTAINTKKAIEVNGPNPKPQ